MKYEMIPNVHDAAFPGGSKVDHKLRASCWRYCREGRCGIPGDKPELPWTELWPQVVMMILSVPLKLSIISMSHFSFHSRILTLILNMSRKSR